MIYGKSVDEFIRANADPIFLHQNGMWEYMDCSNVAEAEDESDDIFG